MEEIAVSVDVHESSPTDAPHTMQATKKNAAIAANDYRKSIPLQDVTHLLRQLERERTDGQTIAYSRPGLGLELIRRSLARYDFPSIYCMRQARIEQCLRCTPRSGLAA